MQIRVQMGKEPRHFMAMFKGKMLVYEGGTGRNTVDAPKAAGSQFRVNQFLKNHDSNNRYYIIFGRR